MQVLPDLGTVYKKVVISSGRPKLIAEEIDNRIRI